MSTYLDTLPYTLITVSLQQNISSAQNKLHPTPNL